MLEMREYGSSFYSYKDAFPLMSWQPDLFR